MIWHGFRWTLLTAPSTITLKCIEKCGRVLNHEYLFVKHWHTCVLTNVRWKRILLEMPIVAHVVEKSLIVAPFTAAHHWSLFCVSLFHIPSNSLRSVLVLSLNMWDRWWWSSKWTLNPSTLFYLPFHLKLTAEICYYPRCWPFNRIGWLDLDSFHSAFSKIVLVFIMPTERFVYSTSQLNSSSLLDLPRAVGLVKAHQVFTRYEVMDPLKNSSFSRIL